MNFEQLGKDWFFNCVTEDLNHHTFEEWMDQRIMVFMGDIDESLININKESIDIQKQLLVTKEYYDKIRELLIDEDVEYKILDKDFTKADMKECFPEFNSFPILIWCQKPYKLIDFIKAKQRTNRAFTDEKLSIFT